LIDIIIDVEFDVVVRILTLRLINDRLLIIGEINIKSTRHPPPPLLRSITVPGDRSPSTDEAPPLNLSTISNETTPQLRTFRGWKRHTEHLDKTRSSKIFRTSHVIIQTPAFYQYNFSLI